MVPRKLLFVLFSDRGCTLNHALLWALALTAEGHAVRVIIEGDATGAAIRLDDGESRFSLLLREARTRGLVAGACLTASGGCGKEEPAASVAAAMTERGIPLLGELEGHASVIPYVHEGWELVTF